MEQQNIDPETGLNMNEYDWCDTSNPKEVMKCPVCGHSIDSDNYVYERTDNSPFYAKDICSLCYYGDIRYMEQRRNYIPIKILSANVINSF